MSMEERGGVGSIAELRELQRQEMSRIEMSAQEKGLKPLLSEQFSTVWVPEDQETGIFPNHFFTSRYNEEEEIVFDEHRIDFPIKDPSQLSVSLGALNALYSRVENAVLYDRSDPTLFVEYS